MNSSIQIVRFVQLEWITKEKMPKNISVAHGGLIYITPACCIYSRIIYYLFIIYCGVTNRIMPDYNKALSDTGIDSSSFTISSEFTEEAQKWFKGDDCGKILQLALQTVGTKYWKMPSSIMNFFTNVEDCHRVYCVQKGQDWTLEGITVILLFIQSGIRIRVTRWSGSRTFLSGNFGDVRFWGRCPGVLRYRRCPVGPKILH